MAEVEHSRVMSKLDYTLVEVNTPTETYRAFACSRVGASHVREGKPCQDAHALWAGTVAADSYVLAAVADGHGDAEHSRSAEGASWAVEAAAGELWDLKSSLAVQATTSQLIAEFKKNFPRRATHRWREAVRQRTEATESSVHDRALYRPFGTTLLVAMWWGDLLLAAQIGDGAAFVVQEDGTVDRLLSPSSDEIGGVTQSLCSANADKHWVTAVRRFPDDAMLVLMTDGVINAFENDTEVQKFVADLGLRIRDHGITQVAEKVPGWLDSYSHQGSGDDMTLVLVWRCPARDRSGDTSQAEHGLDATPASAEPLPERPASLPEGQQLVPSQEEEKASHHGEFPLNEET